MSYHVESLQPLVLVRPLKVLGPVIQLCKWRIIYILKRKEKTKKKKKTKPGLCCLDWSLGKFALAVSASLPFFFYFFIFIFGREKAAVRVL